MQAAKQDALDTMQCASPTSATQRQNSRNLLIFGSRSQKVGTTTLFGRWTSTKTTTQLS